jgi:hypothetical protein
VSLDNIPGLPPLSIQRERRWPHYLMWVALWATSWGLCIAAGVVLGRYLDTIIAWLEHVAPAR